MKHDIVTSHRDDNVRASFHFYNNEDDVESFIAAMKELRGSFAPRRQAPRRNSMEIRVLRGAEVRQLLPMAECIDLMQRTMIAVAGGAGGAAAALDPGDAGRSRHDGR